MMKQILKAGPNQMETLRRLRTEVAAIEKDVTVRSERIRRSLASARSTRVPRRPTSHLRCGSCSLSFVWVGSNAHGSACNRWLASVGVFLVLTRPGVRFAEFPSDGFIGCVFTNGLLPPLDLDGLHRDPEGLRGRSGVSVHHHPCKFAKISGINSKTETADVLPVGVGHKLSDNQR
jgi:hypothetical protein